MTKKPNKIDLSDYIFSVEEFIEFINNYLKQLSTIKVKGEINDVSEKKYYAFFDLKDSEEKDHVVRCFISGQNYRDYTHLLKEGMKVVVYGIPNVYKKGYFSLRISKINPKGEGSWKQALKALKEKLKKKGYFKDERKQELPQFIKTIGLITSRDGAAITDFRRNLGDHGFKVKLLSVKVEGDKAEKEITSAIKWFNKNKPNLDTLVLIRGGGGYENLKAFNSEKLAETIVTSKLPVITGIGHEKDESIADLVADRTLSTPTAVANFLRKRREHLLDQIQKEQQQLFLSFERNIREEKEKIETYRKEMETTVDKILQKDRFKMISLAQSLKQSLSNLIHSFEKSKQKLKDLLYGYQSKFQNKKHKFGIIKEQIGLKFKDKLKEKKNKLDLLDSKLNSLNPETILNRGYSISYTEDGESIKNTNQVKKGDTIITKLSKGKINSLIKKIQNE